MHDEMALSCCDESEYRNKRNTTKNRKSTDGYENHLRIIKRTSHIITSVIPFLMLLNDCPSSSFNKLQILDTRGSISVESRIDIGKTQ